MPNLNWRYSGVTATNRMIAPQLASGCASHGSDPMRRRYCAHGDGAIFCICAAARPLIWHARRNNEMMAGLLLKALGWPLKPIFTSAASGITPGSPVFDPRMDAVIAASEGAASYLKRRATVILHGIDTARYAPPAIVQRRSREAGLPGRYAIGCFGRVRPQKGTDVFVDAMCRLLPRYPDFTAVIVGAVTPRSERVQRAI